MVGQSFGLKASSYERSAQIQQVILRKLLRILPRNRRATERWLDLGSGTGLLEGMLREQGPTPPIDCIDVAHGALVHLRSKQLPNITPLVADMQALPLRNDTYSAVMSSSAFQWLGAPQCALTQTHAVLKQGGVFAFAIFIKGTLEPLCRLQQRFGMHVPVHYPPKEQFVRMVQECGFERIHTLECSVQEYFVSGLDMIRNLSNLGGTAHSGHRLCSGELRLFCDELERECSTELGVQARYQVLLGAAKKGAP
jgi:malonyl-CoA O-methyltransferase